MIFFLCVPVFSKLMFENPFVDICIGLLPVSGCLSTSTTENQYITNKPCRNNERHNHHRYQIHQNALGLYNSLLCMGVLTEA